MLFVDAYFDESLPGQPEPSKTIPEFVVVAGFANQSHLWLDFCIEWGRVLELPKPIGYFHSVEANGKTNEFEGFSADERNAKVIQLLDVIREKRPQPILSAVHPSDYQRLVEEFPGVMPEDPYIFCLYNVIIECAELNADRKGGVYPFEISLIFEENQTMRKKAHEAFDFALADRPEFRPVIRSLVFKDKKKMKPLQAADALAYDLNKEFTRQLRTPNASMRPSLKAVLEKIELRGFSWAWDYPALRPVFERRYRRLCWELKKSN